MMYLQIGVRPVGSSEPFTFLEPRQMLSPVPYALWARDTITNENTMEVVQAGQIEVTVPPSFGPLVLSQTVSFSTPFTLPPAVTLGLETPSDLLEVPHIMTSHVADFTFRLSLPIPTYELISNDNGSYSPSLILVNGNPAVSYYDFIDQQLRFIRALDSTGTTWGPPVVIDEIGLSYVDHPSMTIVNGNPAVSYVDQNNGILNYARSTDPNGTNWGTPILVDDNVATHYPSLTTVNGNPAISYFSSNNSGCSPHSAAQNRPFENKNRSF